jgi:hypothetical protein
VVKEVSADRCRFQVAAEALSQRAITAAYWSGLQRGDRVRGASDRDQAARVSA